jgi:hypothetical protein
VSITNLGNQYITFDYRHPATGRDFNTVLRGAIQPGIYEGGEITITGANTVSIAPFIAYLYSSTDKLVRVETRTAVALTIAESTPVLSITLPWADVVENWLDWNQRAHGSTVITNEVCLGEMIFVDSAINSIDYTVKNWGKQLESDVEDGITPMIITSTTVVDNLNADMVDGCDVLTTSLTASTTTVPRSDVVKTYVDARLPVGTVIESTSLTAPDGYLDCNGSAVSRTTYADLYNYSTTSKGAVTITSANPGVVSLTSHGFSTGSCIELTTTGTLPTNLSANTNYYVIYVGADTFRLATSAANAIAGTAIDTSGGSPSGTHTLRHCPFGISTAANFLLPNRAAVVGVGAGSQTINTRAKTAVLGLVEEDRMQQITGYFTVAGTPPSIGGAFTDNGSIAGTMGASGGSSDTPIGFNSANSPNARTGATTRENRIGMNYYIKY